MRQKSNSTPASSETLVRTIRRATRKHHAAEEKIRASFERCSIWLSWKMMTASNSPGVRRRRVVGSPNRSLEHDRWATDIGHLRRQFLHLSFIIH